MFNYLLQSCMAVFPLVKMEMDKKTAVSHSDVMDKYKTKKDVIRGFGIPTNKDKFEGIDIWYYDKGSTSTTSSYGNANTNLNSNTYSGINANTNANISSTTRSYNKYVEFQFENDRVVNWRTKGIDYGDKPNWLGAYAFGFLIDTVLTVIIALNAY